MKYFKHMSNMRHDTRIKRIINKFGIEGYGIYNFVLEAISENLTTQNPLPDLEDCAEDIASYLKMDTLKVEEILLFCLNQNLFDQDEITGRILCHKMYKFLDESSQKSEAIRAMKEAYEKNNQFRKIPNNSEKLTLEQNRIEQNRIEYIAFGELVKLTKDEYDKLINEYTENIIKDKIETMNNYCLAHGKKYKNYYRALLNWLKKDNKKQIWICKYCNTENSNTEECKKCLKLR